MFGKGCEARFVLNCPDGRIEVWDFAGDWTLPHLDELGVEIAVKIEDCCVMWVKIHG